MSRDVGVRVPYAAQKKASDWKSIGCFFYFCVFCIKMQIETKTKQKRVFFEEKKECFLVRNFSFSKFSFFVVKKLGFMN